MTNRLPAPRGSDGATAPTPVRVLATLEPPAARPALVAGTLLVLAAVGALALARLGLR